MIKRLACITTMAFVCLPAVAQQSLGSLRVRHSPDFLKSATIYQVWLRSFTPQGTLWAARAKLPHIARLGASIVYLSPINLQSTMGGYSNPYRIKDYDSIDPEYGTESDLRAFILEAHSLHLTVLMDIVFYDTSADSVLLKTPSFYMQESGRILMGDWALPRLNFANPELRQYLINNLLHWVQNDGVDGFRCDCASDVPTDFWDQARAALDKVNPDLIMLAEGERPEEMLKAFDISYGFSYLGALQEVFRDGEPASMIRAQWEKNHARFPRGSCFLHACDNHDQNRAIVEFSAAGAKACTVLNFTLDGIPFFYNGQEIGDTTTRDHDSHYPIRWALDEPDGGGIDQVQRAQLAWYTSVFQLRKEHSVLNTGDVTWLDNSNPSNILSYTREDGNQQILVVVNVSNRKCAGTVKTTVKGPIESLFHGNQDTVSVANNDVQFSLGAFGYVVSNIGAR